VLRAVQAMIRGGSFPSFDVASRRRLENSEEGEIPMHLGHPEATATATAGRLPTLRISVTLDAMPVPGTRWKYQGGYLLGLS
jgi:hypothetical protein